MTQKNRDAACKLLLEIVECLGLDDNELCGDDAGCDRWTKATSVITAKLDEKDNDEETTAD